MDPVNADIYVSGAIPPYSEVFDVEEFRAFVYGHARGERIRWWRAMEDPSFDEVRRVPDAAGGKDMLARREVSVADYRAIVQGVNARAVYASQGLLEMGDIRITSMPDELPLSHLDHVVPLGKPLAGGGLAARTIAGKERIVRGEHLTDMAGTVTSSGAALVGVGTNFTLLRAGDIVSSLGQALRVLTVTDATHLTLEAAPTRVWSAVTFKKGEDKLRYSPASSIDLITGTARDYTPGTDCVLNAAGDTVQWLSVADSPAPGVAYSLLYWYYPTFIVREDLGFRRGSVRGIGLPQMVVARMLRSDLAP